MVRASHSKQSIPLKKGKWIAEEDQKMRRFIQTYGIWNWNKLPKAAGLLRTGKSCRLRWVNYLRPDIKRGNFSEEEVETILKMQEDLGNRWSAIAAKLPGRTDNEIKNFWNSQLRKRLNKRQKTEGVQATEVKKEENVSEGNVSSTSDPKSTCLEGLEETPKSPEAYTPEINFSSESNSVHEIDETHTMEENIASEKFPGKLEGLPKESPKSPEVYTPVINVSSDSSSVPKLDRTLTMEENNASKKFAAEPEGPPKETAKSPDVYTLNFSSDSNSVSELDEVHTMEKDNNSEELPAELEGPPKETPKSPDEYTPAINFSSDSNSVSELDEAQDMEEDNASDEFPGELKGFPKEIGMSPAVYTLVINVSSESNCVTKLEEHPTVKENICSQEFPGEPKGLPNETPKSPEVYAPVINFSNDSNSFPKLDESRIKEENNGFEEFAGELKGLPEEPPAMKSMQSLREGKISGNDSGFVSLSSSESLNEINENQTTEMNSDSPGFYEELQNIWELPYLADNYQGRFKDQFLYEDDLWANPFM